MSWPFPIAFSSVNLSGVLWFYPFWSWCWTGWCDIAIVEWYYYLCKKNINFASHRPHNQRPLVSTAAVTIVSQQSRLCASLKTLYMSILHRSCMSSSHTLLSLPRLFVHSKHNWLNQSINQSVPAFDTHANSISVLSLWNMSTVITSLLLTL